MSTGSNIALELEYGNVLVVYCHSGGYPDYNGKMLLTHHNSREAIEKIMELGDMSFLDERLEPTEGSGHKHDFGLREKGVTVFYGRDRGETNVNARMFDSTDNAMRAMEEYFYILRLDGSWEFSDHGGPLQPLTMEACK